MSAIGYTDCDGYWRPSNEAPADYRDLRAIVGELAETDGWWCECPTVTHKDYYPGEGEVWFTQKDHAPDCLWLRVQRWKREGGSDGLD